MHGAGMRAWELHGHSITRAIETFVEITRAIGRLRHGLAGLADMNRASLHILTDAVAALSRARIMATGVQRAQPVEPWHKLMFARVVDKRGTAAEDPVQAPPGPRWLCCCSP